MTSGKSYIIHTSSLAEHLSDAKVHGWDNEISNGVVHSLDMVVMPVNEMR